MAPEIEVAPTCVVSGQLLSKSMALSAHEIGSLKIGRNARLTVRVVLAAAVDFLARSLRLQN